MDVSRLKEVPLEYLASDRLRYEPLRREQFDQLLSVYQEKEVTRYLLSRPSGAADFAPIFENSLDAAVHNGMWAVFAGAELHLCGRVGFFEFSDARRPEIAFLFSAKYWGRGYATEACRTALSWALPHHAWQECIALVRPTNRSALRVCSKLGMKHEYQVSLRGARVDVLRATRRELGRYAAEQPDEPDGE